MGRKGATTVTAQDIKKAGGTVQLLIKSLVSKAKNGDDETKQVAAGMLASLAKQNHSEHTELLFSSGAVKPLVAILVAGSAKAQCFAAGALHVRRAASGPVAQMPAPPFPSPHRSLLRRVDTTPTVPPCGFDASRANP
jgi:hypothetical protein